jgi:cellobiose phosphorylase
LEEDIVVSPYASLLALPFQPREVLANIQRFEDCHVLGLYGFYEALDFTPSRIPAGQDFGLVRSFMAHHQGMILISITNTLKQKIMVNRFHHSPLIQSVDFLLHEAIPLQVSVEKPHPDEMVVIRPRIPPAELKPWSPRIDGPVPKVHYLSNGRMSTMITETGAGYVEWEENALTRWRADTTKDHWGTWIYIKDCESSQVWSAGLQPVKAEPQSYGVQYYPHMAVINRYDHQIASRVEITVHPEDDVEVRQVTISNQSHDPRKIRIFSYSEAVLAPQSTDRRHPAFNKLFIESEFILEYNLIVFKRRMRSEDENRVFVGHMIVLRDGGNSQIAYQTSRSRFLGRGGAIANPKALQQPIGEGEIGITLDPVMALGVETWIPEHKSLEVAFLTIAGSSREEVIALARRYQNWVQIPRTFYQAQNACLQKLTRLNVEVDQLALIQKLYSLLIYPSNELRSSSKTIHNTKGQSGLWKMAISGDYPILLVRVNREEEINLVAELFKIHEYWRAKNLKIDLVILNMQDTSYDQSLHNLLLRLANKQKASLWFNRRGGIFLLRSNQLTEADKILLETASRVVLDGANGDLENQIPEKFVPQIKLPKFVPILTGAIEADEAVALERPDDLIFDNGLGGFSSDGKDYVIYLEPGQWTPAPWVNVIANPEFGFMVSDSGSGYSWYQNSGENRISSWHNDPLLNQTGEAVYLRDEESGQIWSPTPLPARGPSPYLVTHGVGYSRFQTHCYSLQQQVKMFVAKDEPVKFVEIKLKNTSNRTRRIGVFNYVEWVLGTDREITQQHIVSEFDTTNYALLARNSYNEDFRKAEAFLASTLSPNGFTTNRAEFIGRLGHLSCPDALQRIGLSGSIEAGADPCGVLQSLVWLGPGEVKEITFIIGQAATREQALRLVSKYQDVAAIDAVWEEQQAFWEQLLGQVQVEVPDEAMNVLLNRWLLYQTLSCRIWGRSALYQSSGAYGFRDQLQDVNALLHTAPEITKEHILRSAAYQFSEGDVLHWWHPPVGRGVRTRCSDDMLWLPYSTANYVQTTGDTSILDNEIPFLFAPPLEEQEHDRYDLYARQERRATLLEHCRRAILKGHTSGPHGLPLMGSHDWNDGLSGVGIEGAGESIWNGWFLYDILNKFAEIYASQEDHYRASMCRQWAGKLVEALEAEAWDGAWYRRGYYDDGTPLGSITSDENQIDSLAQSWAVLSGGAQPERVEQAMEAVYEKLVKLNDRLVLLYMPPFDKTTKSPGYIKGYPPGIRENGGQYTHAAVWVGWAFAQLGQGERGVELFDLLNPIKHADTPEKVSRYRVEPYVVAADIYSMPPYVGRGGWTWYTGSSGWLYRFGIEGILGIKRLGQYLEVMPCIPANWKSYSFSYKYGEAVYEIYVENPDGKNQEVREVNLDGTAIPDKRILLNDDQKCHQVMIRMG